MYCHFSSCRAYVKLMVAQSQGGLHSCTLCPLCVQLISDFKNTEWIFIPVRCQLFGLSFFFWCRKVITSFEFVFDHIFCPSHHWGNFWKKGIFSCPVFLISLEGCWIGCLLVLTKILIAELHVSTTLQVCKHSLSRLSFNILLPEPTLSGGSMQVPLDFLQFHKPWHQTPLLRNLIFLSILMQPPNNPTVQVLLHNCGNTSWGMTKVIYILPSFIPLKKILYRMDMEYHTLMLMAKTQPQVMKAGDGGWTLSLLASQWNNPCPVPSSLMGLSQVPRAVTLHDPACLSLSLPQSSPRLPGIASQINCRHPHPHRRVCFSREKV